MSVVKEKSRKFESNRKLQIKEFASSAKYSLGSFTYFHMLHALLRFLELDYKRP